MTGEDAGDWAGTMRRLAGQPEDTGGGTFDDSAELTQSELAAGGEGGMNHESASTTYTAGLSE